MSKEYTAKNLVSEMFLSVTFAACTNLTGSPHHNEEMELFFTGTDDDIRLSDADRSSYEKIFSSILVPHTALIVGEEIGQGG